MSWQLERTVQCAHCPWRVDVDPNDIPNGYSRDKHANLSCTIAEEGVINSSAPYMACHETEQAHCVGWLMNQLGPGNNIALRMRMRECGNARELKVIGEQHERFEDTLP